MLKTKPFESFQKEGRPSESDDEGPTAGGSSAQHNVGHQGVKHNPVEGHAGVNELPGPGEREIVHPTRVNGVYDDWSCENTRSPGEETSPVSLDPSPAASNGLYGAFKGLLLAIRANQPTSALLACQA